MVADSGGYAGGNLGSRNPGNPVSERAALTGRYHNLRKRQENPVCTQNLAKLGLVHILRIDFVVVHDWTQSRAGDGNIRMGIFSLQQAGVQRRGKGILSEIRQP